MDNNKSSLKLLKHDDSSFFDRMDTNVNATQLNYNDASEIKCTDEDQMIDDEGCYLSISHLNMHHKER
jgi:hypothetical protein